MKFSNLSLLLIAVVSISSWTPAVSFVPSLSHVSGAYLEPTCQLKLLMAKENDSITEIRNNHNHIRNQMRILDKHVKGALTATFLAGAIWASPVAIMGGGNGPEIGSSMNFCSSPSSFMNHIRTSLFADAKEMASGSGSRVNKDPESLLRYGLPIPKDKEVSSSNTCRMR
jgi:hypothetical protein